MQKRDVIGRTIVGIKREPFYSTAGYHNDVSALILDNGRVIYANAYETEDTPVASLEITPRHRRIKLEK